MSMRMRCGDSNARLDESKAGHAKLRFGRSLVLPTIWTWLRERVSHVPPLSGAPSCLPIGSQRFRAGLRFFAWAASAAHTRFRPGTGGDKIALDRRSHTIRRAVRLLIAKREAPFGRMAFPGMISELGLFCRLVRRLGWWRRRCFGGLPGCRGSRLRWRGLGCRRRRSSRGGIGCRRRR